MWRGQCRTLCWTSAKLKRQGMPQAEGWRWKRIPKVVYKRRTGRLRSRPWGVKISIIQHEKDALP
jgi:hypothetical protein